MNLLGKICYLALLVYTLFAFLTRIIHAPVDYDEGYNLQVSSNLGLYGKYESFDKPFDEKITTGPTVLIPSALFINKEPPPILPRIVPIFYTLALFYIITTKIVKSNRFRLVFLVIWNLIPLSHFYATSVLGEIPAYTFLLLSFYYGTKKRNILSGILLGLSLITKTIFIIGIIPLILMLLRYRNSKKILLYIFQITLGTILILCVWFLLVLIYLNFNITDFVMYIQSLYNFNKSLISNTIALFTDKLRMLNYVFYINSYLFLVVTTLLALFYLLRSRREIILVRYISLFFIIYEIYFFVYGSTNWYRHFFPAVLSLSILLAYSVHQIFSSMNKKIIFLIIGFIFIIALNIQGNFAFINTEETQMKKTIEQNLTFVTRDNIPYMKRHWLLESQVQTAQFIRSLPINSVISGKEWLNAPEIAYLSNKTIRRNPLDNSVHYIIYHIYGLLSPYGYAYGTLDSVLPNKKVIFETPGYIIFEKK